MPPELIPLPPPPADVPWPTERWPRAEPAPEVDRRRLEQVFARVFAQPWPSEVGETHALLAVHRGVLVAERYGPEHHEQSALPSWSMAKSILHALVGLLVGEGRMAVARPAAVPRWQADGDPRRAITLEHLLRMQDGLAFREDYVDVEGSDVLQMLFVRGRDDVAAYAESRPPAHPPGRVWSYSSGTSNIVSALTSRLVGTGEAHARFLRARLFDRLGMRSADPRYDAAGTWIGSSFVFATARDFARFGLLYLRDGCWDGERLLPAGWVDHARTPTPGSGGEYGAHWWLALDGSGTFSANGYRGQYTVVVPARDLVVVRLGASLPEQKRGVITGLAEIVRCFPLSQHARGAG